MQFNAINEKIEEIKDDSGKLNSFVEEYKPFIASCANKVSGKYLNYGSDDELSIAMMAFVEAINSFDSSKGNFFSLSRNVIKKRLIDYYRIQSRHNNVVPLTLHMDGQNEDFDISSGEAFQIFSDQRLAEYRRLELGELGKELAAWNITYSDLARVSPKHSKTRSQCSKLVGLILSQPDMMQQVMVKRYLPITQLEKVSGIPQKTIERFRKYIIAVVVIITGDYTFIRDYINL